MLIKIIEHVIAHTMRGLLHAYFDSSIELDPETLNVLLTLNTS